MDRVEVTTLGGVVLPTVRKREGGSLFDDETGTAAARAETYRRETVRLVDHINTRPDHAICVGSVKDRDMLRQVFNQWRKDNTINQNPTIRIDYGVPDGTIRIGDGR